MKCPKCGAEISDNADVCDNCGQPIYEIHKKIQSSEDERLLTKKIIRYGLIIIVVLLVIVSAAYLILTNTNNDKNFNIGSVTMQVPENVNLTQVNASSTNSSVLQTFVDTSNNVMVSYLNTSNAQGAANAKQVDTNLKHYTSLSNKTLNDNCNIYSVPNKIGYNYLGSYQSDDSFILIGGNNLNNVANMLNSIKS